MFLSVGVFVLGFVFGILFCFNVSFVVLFGWLVFLGFGFVFVRLVGLVNWFLFIIILVVGLGEFVGIDF